MTTDSSDSAALSSSELDSEPKIRALSIHEGQNKTVREEPHQLVMYIHHNHNLVSVLNANIIFIKVLYCIRYVPRNYEEIKQLSELVTLSSPRQLSVYIGVYLTQLTLHIL